MGELRTMVYVCLDEVALLLKARVTGYVAGPCGLGVVIVVGPFGEVVGEFHTNGIGSSVLKVDDNKLFVLVGGLEERRFLIVGLEAENVAVLCLRKVSTMPFQNAAVGRYTSLCAKTRASLISPGSL